MKNIVLVGFMGTGKTVIARALADELGRKCVSIDELIEKSERMSISDIFAQKGEAYFRKLEKYFVKEVCELHNQVIDAGGGAVLDPVNMDNFKKSGIVISLWADAETILKRTERNTQRPLLNVDDPKKAINELLDARKPFYEKADFHIDTTRGDVSAIVTRIIEVVHKEKGLDLYEKKDENFGSRVWGLFITKLLKNADTKIMVTDSDGRIIFTNAKFQKFFGLSEADMLGREWAEVILSEGDREAARKDFGDISKSNSACQFALDVMDKEGNKSLFSWVASPLKEKQGIFVLFIGRVAVNGTIGKRPGIHPATNREILNVILSGSRKSAPETAIHSLRVMSFAVALAEKINMEPGRIAILKIAAILHDIGKLAVDDDILYKKGKLDGREFNQIKKHPKWSVEMIKPLSFLNSVLPIIISHHENYDGSGYPRGIKGENIPLESRIISIADVYEALTADRVYRKAFTKEEAISIMESEKGWKLDPKLTDIFLELVRSGKLECDI